MCSATRFWVRTAALCVVGCGPGLFAASPPLRICADPNNLPYSNRQQQGFENEMAKMMGADMGKEITYMWFPQRGAFFRKTLDAVQCDVVMGVPVGLEGVSTTRPYYRSGYVFVSRKDRHLQVHSLDDPRLRKLKIGVHVLGDGDSDVPPVHALTSRGIVRNLVGYSIFGNLEEADPPSDVIKAVERGEVDVAVAWGPMAGYFARQSAVTLEITSIDPDPSDPGLPLAFDIAMGVRPRDEGLRQQLDAELERRRPEIERLLASYGVPQRTLSRTTSEGY